MSFIQYLKDTRGELRHVAWPTRTQTIVYTVIVMALSLFIAGYLGFFDYIFTTGLSRALQFLPQNSSSIYQPISTTTDTTSSLDTGGLMVTPVAPPPAPTPAPSGLPSFQ